MVGSGNPAATHCSMPFMSLSRVRISGFAAGREKWPYVRLLENLTKAHSTISESSITFSRPKGTLRSMLFKGENLNQWVEGTGKADVRVWPRKAFPVRAAQSPRGLSILRMPGSPRSPCPGDGWGRRTTGQGFCFQWGGNLKDGIWSGF